MANSTPQPSPKTSSEFFSGRRVLVACSGGADSVALVHLFTALSKRLQFDIGIAHIHHGRAATAQGTDARRLAQEFVKKLAAQLEIPFFTNDGKSLELESQSESALRDLRRKLLNEWRDNGAAGERFTDLAFGHHADDLLETRLIRMIRGTGAQGLGAMWEIRPGVLRPFLSVTRLELRTYLAELGADWSEDLSNQDSKYLRNWLRNEWLPQLEAYRPTSCAKLARSFESLAQALEMPSLLAPTLLESGAQTGAASAASLFKFDERDICEVDLVLFRDLGLDERRRVMASVLASLLSRGIVREFKQTHVMEILKRLDTAQKVHMFYLLGLTWEVISGRLRIVSVKIG